MATQEAMTFEHGLNLLIEETKCDLKPPEDEPKTLPLSSIRTANSVFQPRQFEDGTLAESVDHVKSLVEAIFNEPSGKLDPITVWWTGKHWRILDGAHRYQAYLEVKRQEKLKDSNIPVMVFKGDLYQAIAESARLNSKDKLPMTKDDKANRAWKLTVLGKHSKSEIHMICKVGTTTISRMRTILNEIKEKVPQENIFKVALDLTWREAQDFLKKEPKAHDEAWKEKQAKEWSRRLAKAFGKQPLKIPEVFALAIEKYSEKLPTELIHSWSELVENLKDELEHEF